MMLAFGLLVFVMMVAAVGAIYVTAYVVVATFVALFRTIARWADQ